MKTIQPGEVRITKCTFCDGGCAVKAACSEDGSIAIQPANPAFPVMCQKIGMWREYREHPDRVIHPLKNVGTREEPRWEQIAWETALDEISEKLGALIACYGPETLAVSEMVGNTGFGGMVRRFMNALGSPNYISPLLLCVGNTAQVHRATYGWYTFANWGKADFILYFGQNRNKNLWPHERAMLDAALARGAKLVVVDPRRTETAALADAHLRVRYGTDAALALAMINVIIAEGLYDKEFVAANTVGFSELAERVVEFTPAWAAAECGIEAGQIVELARGYAKAEAAIIPWGVVADMQLNSTNLIRCQCILRALCGFIGTAEIVVGPATGHVGDTEFAAFDLLAPEQRAKQIGMDAYPLFSFKGLDCYNGVYADHGLGMPTNIMTCSAVAHPNHLFEAMRTGKPYPVKAFFAIGNNTVMSYAGQQQIVEGFLNQELVVVYDHWMTPTAQMADYVLPADTWMERDCYGSGLDLAPSVAPGCGFIEPLGEVRDLYSVVKGLADRMGLSEMFPWADCYELYDWRLAPSGRTWREVVEKGSLQLAPAAAGEFMTPSGKIELASSVFAAIGADPLPGYLYPDERSGSAEKYPLVVSACCREEFSYNTNLHQIACLRDLAPEPELYIHPADMERYGLQDGQWANVVTPCGSVQLIARADDAQREGEVRVPHGWWKPEMTQGVGNGLSGAAMYNDGAIFTGEDWNLDPVQGLPNFRGGMRAKVSPAE